VAEADSQTRPARVPAIAEPSGTFSPAKLLLLGGSSILGIGAACLMLMGRPVDRFPATPGQPEPHPLASPSAPPTELRPAALVLAPANAPIASTVASVPTVPESLLNGLEAAVTRDAAADLDRIWNAVVTHCPGDNAGTGEREESRPEFVLTFDANGEEIARSASGDRGAGPGLSACFLSFQEQRLRVPPPGRTVQVTVAAPILQRR
jgi:hypothetical protein